MLNLLIQKCLHIRILILCLYAESSLLQCPVSDLGPSRSPCEASVLPWSFTPNEKQVNSVRKSVRERARESEREKEGEGGRGREEREKEQGEKSKCKIEELESTYKKETERSQVCRRAHLMQEEIRQTKQVPLQECPHRSISPREMGKAARASGYFSTALFSRISAIPGAKPPHRSF